MSATLRVCLFVVVFKKRVYDISFPLVPDPLSTRENQSHHEASSSTECIESSCAQEALVLSLAFCLTRRCFSIQNQKRL